MGSDIHAMKGRPAFRLHKILCLSALLLSLLWLTACTTLSVLPDPLSGSVEPAGVPQSEPSDGNATASVKKGDGPVLLVTGEYMPYTSETLPEGGWFTGRVQEIFAEMGMETEVRFYPWRRCEAMVEAGEAWATFPYGDSEEARARFLISDPLVKSVHRYFYLQGNTAFAEEAASHTALAQFTAPVFGGANGYWYGTRENLENLGMTVEWASDVAGLVQMLESGRIDFFIEDEAVAWAVLEKTFPGEADRFAVLPQEAAIRDYRLLISKTYPDTEKLKARFEEALARIGQAASE